MAEIAPKYVTDYAGLNPNQKITNSQTGFSVNDPTDQFGSGSINANKLFFSQKPTGAGTELFGPQVLKNGQLSNVDLSGNQDWNNYQNSLQALQGYNNAASKNQYMTGAADYQNFQNQLQQNWMNQYGNLGINQANGTMWNSNLEGQYQKYLQDQLTAAQQGLVSKLGADVVGSNLVGNYNSFATRAGFNPTSGQTIGYDQLQNYLAGPQQEVALDPNSTFVQRAQGTLPAQQFSGGQYTGSDPNAPENNPQIAAQLNAMRVASDNAARYVEPNVSFETNPTLTNEQARAQLLQEAALTQQGQRIQYDAQGNPIAAPALTTSQVGYNPSLPTAADGGVKFGVNNVTGMNEFEPLTPRDQPGYGTDAYYGIPGIQNQLTAMQNTVQGGGDNVANTQAPTGTGQYSEASTGSTEDDLMKQLMEIATNEAKLRQANRVGMANVADQPIAQSFISGQQASLERRLANDLSAAGMYAEPLKLQLANEQAKRAAALDVSKFEEDKKKNAQEEAYRQAVLNKPITLTDGTILVDPLTGKPILENTKNFAPKSSSSSGNSLVDAINASFAAKK